VTSSPRGEAAGRGGLPAGFAERAQIDDGSRLRALRAPFTVSAVPVLSKCRAPGCELLTIGRLCIRHDASSLSILARQRRWRWDRTLRSAVEPRPAAETEPLAAR